MRTMVVATLGALGVGMAGAALAHHGVSTYRMDVVETLDGEVARWSFGSPHTWLTLRVEGASWEIEGAPPRWMSGQGFTCRRQRPQGEPFRLAWRAMTAL